MFGRKYRVTMFHSNDRPDKTVTEVMTVHDYSYGPGRQADRFVDSSELGCSRAYATQDDLHAIKFFLQEQGWISKIVKPA